MDHCAIIPARLVLAGCCTGVVACPTNVSNSIPPASFAFLFVLSSLSLEGDVCKVAAARRRATGQGVTGVENNSDRAEGCGRFFDFLHASGLFDA